MGMTVGILSRRSRDDPSRIFGPPTAFFSECCIEAGRLGLRAAVFGTEDLDTAGSSITAAIYTGGRWVERRVMPWPDVVYDRAPVFDAAYTPAVDPVRHRLMDAGIPFINPPPLLHFAADKRATYELLCRYGVPVPATSVLARGELPAYVDHFDHLFLKPVQGSNGAGIVEIRRHPRNRFIVRYGVERRKAQGVRQLFSVIGSMVGKPVFQDGLYLVQQGISTASSGREGGPRFDLRVIMQKGERGAWGVTGLAARVCRTDVPTANLSTGAWAEVAEHVLDARYGVEIRLALLDSISTTCLMICRRLDRDICPFGELGIDIVPDADGKPWVLEINAKPGRSVFRRLACFAAEAADRRRFMRIRRRSVALPFRYARTLADTPRNKKGSAP